MGAPIIRQTAWISVIPQVMVMGLLVLIWYSLQVEDFVWWGVISYLILSYSLRRLIASEHRQGMMLVKQEKYREAIPHFENSYSFFKQHAWLDKYRYLTLLTSSKISYREMALVNAAFCHGQLGEGQESKGYYERVLQEFPENGIALAALRLINSFDRKQEE